MRVVEPKHAPASVSKHKQVLVIIIVRHVEPFVHVVHERLMILQSFLYIYQKLFFNKYIL